LISAGIGALGVRERAIVGSWLRASIALSC